MLLAEAINVLCPGAQHRGYCDDSTKEQYDKLEWVDARPKPKWEDLVETMKLVSPKAAAIAARQSLEDRVKALEDAAR